MPRYEDFYVYAHRTLVARDKGEIFYIGKGIGNRAWTKSDRNRHWKSVVAKYGYSVQILMGGLTEQQAFELERSFISLWRKSLCNMTDGGEGPSGCKRSPATREKMGAAKRGKVSHFKDKKRGPLSNEHREKLRLARTGKARGANSLEWNANISNALKGRNLSREHILAQSLSQKGKPWSEARRLAQGKRNVG